jgi:hypothetical protein
MKASEIATEAARLVNGERNATHGDAYKNHKNIADLWNAFLGDRLANRLSPQDVLLMMALLKIARTQTGVLNLDDYIDAAGYVALAGEIAQG